MNSFHSSSCHIFLCHKSHFPSMWLSSRAQPCDSFPDAFNRFQPLVRLSMEQRTHFPFPFPSGLFNPAQTNAKIWVIYATSTSSFTPQPTILPFQCIPVTCFVVVVWRDRLGKMCKLFIFPEIAIITFSVNQHSPPPVVLAPKKKGTV